jgi:hypothetical protein
VHRCGNEAPRWSVTCGSAYRSRYVIIGVGGIDSAEAAMEKLDAGADLVQVYTGLIYEGPALLKRINNAYVTWRLKPEVKLIECPRDAMQGIGPFIPTEVKVKYLNDCCCGGLRHHRHRQFR